MDGNPNSRMAAKNGTYTVNDTTAVTNKEFTSVYIAEDTVIASLKVNGNGTDVKGDYISTPGTAVKVNTLITTVGDDYFSEIQLTSGQVTLILK